MIPCSLLSTLSATSLLTATVQQLPLFEGTPHCPRGTLVWPHLASPSWSTELAWSPLQKLRERERGFDTNNNDNNRNHMETRAGGGCREGRNRAVSALQLPSLMKVSLLFRFASLLGGFSQLGCMSWVLSFSSVRGGL